MGFNAAFNRTGNPYKEDTDKIVLLDTKDVMSEAVEEAVMCVCVIRK